MRNKIKVFSSFSMFLRILITSLIILSNMCPFAFSTCLDRTQLFLHKKAVITELLDSEKSDRYIILTDVAKEFVTCRSSRNVEWYYVGQGEPSRLQETASVQIKTEPQDGSLEYCMTSRISFYHKQSDSDLSKHTGEYICQEIGNSSNRASTFIFIGKGGNGAVFLHSRKTITRSLSPENVTDSSFFVPCVTSTPFVNATLLRRANANSKFQVISGQNSNNNNGPFVATFDPRYGFQVNTSGSQNLSMFYGEYKCVSKIPPGPKGKRPSENADADFVIYNLVKPSTFKAYPPEREVFTSTILNLTCESTEESVMLKEVRIRPHHAGGVGLEDYVYDDDQGAVDGGSNSVEDDIVETVEKNEQKLHVANYIENNPVPGSFGEFQCLSEKDKRVLHSWKYRILGKKEDKLSGIKFNKRDNSFSCRTKSGMPGRLSFVSCRTPSECRINAICLEKSENCRGYSNATKALCHRGNHFCGKIFYKGGSGLIRCIGEGIDQIRGFTDEANDQRLRMGFHKLKPSETVLLSISGMALMDEDTDDEQLLEGQEVEVSLNLGYYYFVHPVQWAIKFKNGSSSHISPESAELKKNKLHRTIEAKLRIPFTSNTNVSLEEPSDIVGINALIPLRSSLEPSWKTITLPIRVTGKLPGSQFVEIVVTENELSPTGRSDIEFDEVTQASENLLDQPESGIQSKNDVSAREEIQMDDVTTLLPM